MYYVLRRVFNDCIGCDRVSIFTTVNDVLVTKEYKHKYQSSNKIRY